MLKENRTCFQLIFVRHGKSEYTQEFPDLIPKGIEQVQNGAGIAEPFLRNVHSKKIRTVTSPAARAQGSAMHFTRLLGLHQADRKHIEALRPVDIRDKKKAGEVFDAVGRGEISYFDEVFEDPEIFEPRSSIDYRVRRFVLRQMQSFIKETNRYQAVCIFAHCETFAGIAEHVFRGPRTTGDELVPYGHPFRMFLTRYDKGRLGVNLESIHGRRVLYFHASDLGVGNMYDLMGG